MLAYRIFRLSVADSALGTALSQTTSLCNDLKHSLKESVQNLLPWTLKTADKGVDGLMEELEGSLYRCEVTSPIRLRANLSNKCTTVILMFPTESG